MLLCWWAVCLIRHLPLLAIASSLSAVLTVDPSYCVPVGWPPDVYNDSVDRVIWGGTFRTFFHGFWAVFWYFFPLFDLPKPRKALQLQRFRGGYVSYPPWRQKIKKIKLPGMLDRPAASKLTASLFLFFYCPVCLFLMKRLFMPFAPRFHHSRPQGS